MMLLSGRCLFALMIGAVVTILSGCYDGWEDYGDDKNGTPTATPTAPAPKSFFYILFEPIWLADAAIVEGGTCFPANGTAVYRKAEWGERVASLTRGLSGVAEKVVVQDHRIAEDDCGVLGGLEYAASRLSPWLPDDPPGVDSMDRPIIELKAVFWEEDVSHAAPAVVTAEHWKGWQKQKDSGRNAFSVSYFVLEDKPSPHVYFQDWRDALPAAAMQLGTPIDSGSIDPTPSGAAAREEVIAKDTASLVSYLGSLGGRN